ncbi:TonB-dependent receptor [Sphingobacterium spiritivorum]|uniref:TonB-dependent receptor n=1 Tax=Sphingobacterium spiritivorum TaxID=258 RepID=UPI003DA4599E
MRVLILTFLSILLAFNGYSQTYFIGRVVDEERKPLQFASVTNLRTQLVSFTNDRGEFRIKLENNQDSIRIKVVFVGKQTVTIGFKPNDAAQSQIIILKELSLKLDEVDVIPSYKRDGGSNSAITIDRQAIDQLQAFSLVDVMNSLPGKKSTALDLNTLKTLTFRGGMGGNSSIRDFNNSLGIAIIMDGARLSNDANMQSRGVSRNGMARTTITTNSYRDSYWGNQGSKSYDTPYQGIDLRDIPVNNIEKIEVIQGVAPAQYGEVTDGAVIIDRQAGKSPYLINFNINGGSTSSGINKGFQLPNNLGAINISANWTHSNADPKDKVKTFGRFSQSMTWTKQFKDIKNTLSVDYGSRNDEKKQDPDDDTERTSKFKNSNLGISNRLSYNLNSTWIRNLQFNTNLAVGNQESSSQYIVNRGLTAIADLDTSGIYEGKFINGSYMADEIIIGKPLTIGSSLSAASIFHAGEVVHSLSYGMNFNLSNNGGRGVISDPERPRLVGTNNQNLRPYSFESLPKAVNYGFYIQDQFKMKIDDRELSNNIGLRYDIQNGFGTIQPRINSRLKWNKSLSFTGALGLGSKAPTLAHLYPGPAYIDYDLIKATTGGTDPSLYLLFTDKFTPDNSHLKPSKSLQIELGAEYEHSLFHTSIYAYYKNNWDIFTTQQTLRRYELPEYDVWLNAQTQKFEYTPNGKYRFEGGFIDFNMVNGSASQSYGFDWSVFTRKIPYINTSFSLLTSLVYNTFAANSNASVNPPNKILISNDDYIKTVYYEPDKSSNLLFMTKVNTVTHLPSIGFVLNFNIDLNWLDNNRTISNTSPIAYLDDKIRYVALSGSESLDVPFAQLNRLSKETKVKNIPMPYANISLGVEKEIRKNFRINLRGYNVFDFRPYKVYYLDSGLEEIFNPNGKPSLTIGTTLKF